MQVDTATYKAEFLSHHYAGYLRPLQAYAMGLIYWWARLAALMPGVANVLTQTPGLRRAATSAAGLCHADVYAVVPPARPAQRRASTSAALA